MEGWGNDMMKTIYREWGKYFCNRDIMDKAALYYTKAIEYNTNDAEIFHSRSIAYLKIAKVKESLKDAFKALELQPEHPDFNFQFTEALFHCNKFEKTMTELYNLSRVFTGKLKPFNAKIDILESTFNQSLGPNLTKFGLENRKTFDKVGERKLKSDIDKNCLSTKFGQDLEIHPRKLEKRKLAYKVALQDYFGRSWQDLIFLSKLRDDKTLLLKQTPITTSELLEKIMEKYYQSRRLMKMHQARNPLYNLREEKQPNLKMRKKAREDHIYRVQAQTRRDTFNFLCKIKQLRRQKKVVALRNFIEDVMGKYTIIKTTRVMPWKLEFINEVYNVMALTYMDLLKVPNDIMTYNEQNRLYKLLSIQPMQMQMTKRTVFGDRLPFPGELDYEYRLYIKRVRRLHTWLKFTEYPIERIFIYNLLSHCHLERNKLEECLKEAIKGRTEAANCHNIIWNFLCSLQIIRALTLQNRFGECKYYYAKAKELIRSFKYAKDAKLLLFMAGSLNKRLKIINNKKNEKQSRLSK